MTLTTQTWRVAGPYTVRSDSLINRLTDIKDAFVANNADSNGLWQEDTFTLTGTELFLKIKRKGSPSGVLGTFRGIIFGSSTSANYGSSPNLIATTTYTNACANNVLFMGCGETIDTTAPTMTSIASTLMFNLATTKFTRGFALNGDYRYHSSSQAYGLIGAESTMYIVECDRMCAVVFVGASTYSWGVFGECIENLSNNTGIWACFGCTLVLSGVLASQTSRAAATVAEGSPFPIFSTNALQAGTNGLSLRTCGAYNNGASGISEVGRIWTAMTHGADTSVLESAGNAILAPVLMGRKLDTLAATSDYGLLGLARQLRIGPFATGGIKRVFTGTPTLRGYIVSPATGPVAQGVVFDNNP